MISETGYDITGMITSLGLAGLTVSLAAKDSASNFFGGLVIIADKPFTVGDWIQTPEMEGVVTDRHPPHHPDPHLQRRRGGHS